MRVRLDLAYLGTRFEGWQVQERLAPALPPRTVQGVLEEAVGALLGQPTRVHGAGRTDAGVHAEGQVAHFDLPEGAPRIPFAGLQRALNARLPEDARVTGAAAAAGDWHARYSATRKLYRYRLRRGDHLPPHQGLVEALARERLDVERMRTAAASLVGRRDFGPFSVSGGAAVTTVRDLRRLTVEEEGDVLVVSAVADGFLRGMVRRLVGTLREAGRGRIAPEEALFRPGPTAEARGLTLVRVDYAPPGAGAPDRSDGTRTVQ